MKGYRQYKHAPPTYVSPTLGMIHAVPSHRYGRIIDLFIPEVQVEQNKHDTDALFTGM